MYKLKARTYGVYLVSLLLNSFRAQVAKEKTKITFFPKRSLLTFDICFALSVAIFDYKQTRIETGLNSDGKGADELLFGEPVAPLLFSLCLSSTHERAKNVCLLFARVRFIICTNTCWIYILPCCSSVHVLIESCSCVLCTGEEETR